MEDNWVQYAKMDLQVARRELYVSEDTEEVLTPIVCFHAQQAVEKVLKAYLIKNNIDFEKIHNLETLRKLCATVDVAFEELDFGDLNYYGVSTRYPDGLMEMPTFDKSKELYELSEGITDFILKKLDTLLPKDENDTKK